MGTLTNEQLAIKNLLNICSRIYGNLRNECVTYVLRRNFVKQQFPNIIYLDAAEHF